MSINWLPLSDRKNMPSVRIEIEEYCGQIYGGYYSPTDNKIVAVYRNYDYNERNLASTLAHEYRHVIQRNIRNVPTVVLQIPPNIVQNYNNSIRWYFRSSISEFDALLYQIKVANCDVDHWWLKKLVLPKNPTQETYY